MKPSEYRAIKVWGELLLSDYSYIERQQELAARDKAPPLAIYKRNGEWKTLDGVANEHIKFTIAFNYPDSAAQARPVKKGE